MLHDWPLNVRELLKVVTEAEVLSRSTPTIGFEHLPSAIAARIQYEGQDELEDTTVDPEPPLRRTTRRPSSGVVREPFAAGPHHARAPPGADARGAGHARSADCNGSVAQVARRLNRQYAVVWRIIQRYGIDAGVIPQEREHLMADAKVVLRQGRARPLWFGHPWVYANGVARVEGDPAPGDVVALCDHDGRFIGRGFYNPRSQIPVRLCTRADEPVDAAFFRARIARARAARARLGLPSERTNVYRLVNSEGDDLPGLVVDVYGDAAVVQITTLGISARRNEIFDALEAELGHARRSSRSRRPPTPSWRASPPARASRAASRATTRDGRRGRHRAGGRAALRTEDRDVHRPARDPRPRRRAGARARACSISTPTPAASRWPPRAAAPRR